MRQTLTKVNKQKLLQVNNLLLIEKGKENDKPNKVEAEGLFKCENSSWFNKRFVLDLIILGGQQWQSQRGRGQGAGRGGRGGRGGTYGGQGASYGAGGQGGSYSGGNQGGTRGRGRQQGATYNHQQQPGSSRGGRGRGRGSSANNQNQSWNQNYSSFKNAPNQTFPTGSYSSVEESSQSNYGSQRGG